MARSMPSQAGFCPDFPFVLGWTVAAEGATRGCDQR
jgi:hypothetical protein